jgi:arsenate reductase (thioredoxin)
LTSPPTAPSTCASIWVGSPCRILIVVCAEAEDSCTAIWPGVLSRLLWQFDDPAVAEGAEEEQLAKFRAVRDQIEEKILGWLAEVGLPRS